MEYYEKSDHSSFKRYCKTLELKNDPDLIKRYREVHETRNSWPEIPRGIREVGIIDMEIYIDGTRLFMIMDTIPGFDHDKAMAELAQKPRQKEWEAYVSAFQKTSAEATADEKWHLIERIFKLP
ncbi:MAG TPA: L-rhamnose mutarotase [Bacteroidales bacterium]|nr:L-rhamnose mutarotase [Bacteroidales bacterium]